MFVPCPEIQSVRRRRRRSAQPRRCPRRRRPGAPAHQPQSRRRAQRCLRFTAARPVPARHLHRLRRHRRRHSCLPGRRTRPQLHRAGHRRPGPAPVPGLHDQREPERAAGHQRERRNRPRSRHRRPALRAELLPQRRRRALHLVRGLRATPARLQAGGELGHDVRRWLRLSRERDALSGPHRERFDVPGGPGHRRRGFVADDGLAGGEVRDDITRSRPLRERGAARSLPRVGG